VNRLAIAAALLVGAAHFLQARSAVRQTPAQPRATAPPLFGANVDLVRLDVSIMRDGRPVRGLGVRDFSIRDRGVRQRVASVLLVDELPVNVVIVLDTSGSVAGERLAQLIVAGNALLGALRHDDRAALITFSRDVRVAVPLTSDRSMLQSALADLKGDGPTAIRDAVWVALQLAPDDNSRSLVLLFTDGVDNASWLSRSSIVAGVRRAGIVIHAVELAGNVPLEPMSPRASIMWPGTIAASPSAAPSFLEELVGAAGGRRWSTTASRDLRSLFARAIEEMRARYLVSFYPEGVRRDGWHDLKVSVDVPGDVTARPGYFGSIQD
jgi:Ca-activated chloride channel homolog